MQTLQHFDRNFLSLTLMQHATAALCGTFVIRVLKLRCRSPLFALGLWEGWFRAGLEAAANPAIDRLQKVTELAAPAQERVHHGRKGQRVAVVVEGACGLRRRRRH
jgi:hypothetical protein